MAYVDTFNSSSSHVTQDMFKCFKLIEKLTRATRTTEAKVQGGGSYFWLSRCLASEMGGVIGLLFYPTYVMRTSLYVLRFGTELV